MPAARRSANGSVADVLVIGYGNDLRSDDGAGRWVADRIEELDMAGVDVVSVAQLTPELAVAIAGRRLVVLVDASVDTEELTVSDIDPSQGSGVMSHHGDPSTVIAMAASVGTLPARAVLVSIPATDLGMGFSMSPPTAAAAEQAVARITDLVLA